MPTQTYQRVMAALASEGPEQWDAIAAELPGFPDGLDDVVHRRWIVNALGTGSAASVRWMLKKGVDLDFRDDEGYTPLHAVIERAAADRYELLELLLRAGAPVNRKGVNDWTPAHMAAARDDVEALKILVRYGARSVDPDRDRRVRDAAGGSTPSREEQRGEIPGDAGLVSSGNHRTDAHAFYENLGYQFTGRRYKKAISS